MTKLEKKDKMHQKTEGGQKGEKGNRLHFRTEYLHFIPSTSL